jgi:hypothetical protein
MSEDLWMGLLLVITAIGILIWLFRVCIPAIRICWQTRTARNWMQLALSPWQGRVTGLTSFLAMILSFPIGVLLLILIGIRNCVSRNA